MKFISLYLIINILFFSTAKILGVERLVLNIDYLIPIFFVCYGYRKIAIIWFILFFLIDFILVFSQIFPFFRIIDLIYIFKFIFLTSPIYIFYIVLSFVLIIFFSFLCSKFKFLKKGFNYFFIVISIIFTTDTFLSNKNILTLSGAINFIEKQNSTFKEALFIKENTMKVGKPSGVTSHLYKQIEQGEVKSNKILLIVNESFGLAKSDKVIQDILSPLFLLKQDIQFFNISHYPYMGATVFGELRELCRASPENLNIKQITVGFEHCLPNELKKFGYNSTAFHGALGIMYDRYIWYPRLGFDKIFFRESQNWKTRCYSFPGICDSEFLNNIAEEFKEDNKFVYWLTLNTHINYDLRDLEKDSFDCNKYNININSQSCRNFKLQKQFFENLEILLRHPSMRGVEVYITGDHSPPIYNLGEKIKYFDGDNIVLLHFKMKD